MIERLDSHLGTLFDELRALGRFDETTIILVSDHGFLPIEKEVRVGTLLRTLGLLEADAQGKVTTWKAYFWPQGGSGAIYLHPLATAEDRRKVDDVLRLLQQNPAWGVGRVLRGADLTALGDLAGAYAVLDALPGFCFGRPVDATALVGPKLGGIHGHLPSRPDLRASFIARGPGIRKNHDLGLVRLLDVAPTVARVLGVNLGKVEGRVLAEAFVKPAAPVRVGARPGPP
jgi:arylsulfatase A-like enzyme